MTRVQIVLRLLVIVALVELAIMIGFAMLPLELEDYVSAILDTAILVLVSAPIIYFWIIKPYEAAHEALVEQIQHLAHHDPLTQLPNRRLLSEFLQKLLAGVARHGYFGALIFVDLDGFKAINDNHGHDAGDEVLLAVAQRLSKFVRTGDIVARLGGDEFIVVLDRLDRDGEEAKRKAWLTCERIQKELRKSISFQSVKLRIDASIGLRMLRPEPTTTDRVIREADAAMYRAKQEGKGRVVGHDS
jgi:two-component system cell cycle response regulator